MSDEQKTTQQECCPPFEGMPFAEMMKKMMSQQGQGCGCQMMMSQMMGQPGMACDCSEMMAMCGGALDEEETVTETS